MNASDIVKIARANYAPIPLFQDVRGATDNQAMLLMSTTLMAAIGSQKPAALISLLETLFCRDMIMEYKSSQPRLFVKRYVEMISNMILHCQKRSRLGSLFKNSPWLNDKVQNAWRTTAAPMFAEGIIAAEFANNSRDYNYSNLTESYTPDENKTARDAAGEYMYVDLGTLHSRFVDNVAVIDNKVVAGGADYRRIDYGQSFFVDNADDADMRLSSAMTFRMSLKQFIPRNKDTNLFDIDKGGVTECMYRAVISQLLILDGSYFNDNRMKSMVGVSYIPESVDLTYAWILIMRDYTTLTYIKMLRDNRVPDNFLATLQITDTTTNMRFNTKLEEINTIINRRFGSFGRERFLDGNETDSFRRILMSRDFIDDQAFQHELVVFWITATQNTRLTTSALTKSHDNTFTATSVERMFVKRDIANAVRTKIKNWYFNIFKTALDDNDPLMIPLIDLFNINLHVIVNSAFEIINSCSFMGVYHMFAVSEAFGVNIILLQSGYAIQYDKIGGSDISVYLCEKRDVIGNIYIRILGETAQGSATLYTHYVSIVFQDEFENLSAIKNALASARGGSAQSSTILENATIEVLSSNKSLDQLKAKEFLMTLRHKGFSSMSQMKKAMHIINTWLLGNLREESGMQTAFVQSQLLVASAGYSYFLVPEAMRIFYDVFYNIIASSSSSLSSNDNQETLLYQIKYVLTFVYVLNLNYKNRVKKLRDGIEPADMTGKITGYYEDLSDVPKEAYHVIYLPSTLGFNRDDSPSKGFTRDDDDRTHVLGVYGSKCMLIKKHGNYMKEESIAYIKRLFETVATQTMQAMLDAAIMVVYFMYVPPLFDTDDLASSDNDSGRLQNTLFYISRNFTNQPILPPLENFYKKAVLYGMRMFADDHRDAIMNTVRLHLLHHPDHFHQTPFWDFYSTCLFNLFLAMDHGDSIVERGGGAGEEKVIQSNSYIFPAVTPTKARLGLVFSKHEEKKHTFDFAIDFTLLKNHNSSKFSSGTAFILAWFSSSDEISPVPYGWKKKETTAAAATLSSTTVQLGYKYDNKPSETIDDNSNNTFDRYVKGTRISYSEVDIDKAGSNGMIVFMLDKAAVARNLKGRVFLHIAVVTKDKDVLKRRGHAFINLRDIVETNKSFAVRLWEGPIKNRLAIDGSFNMVSAMDYKPVFDFDLTVIDPRGVVFENEPESDINKFKGKKQVFFENAPNSLFTKVQMQAVAKYLVALNKTLGRQALEMHSLLYVNFPMHLNVVPLWSSLYMPPIFVHMNVLRRRLEIKLHDEGISRQDFVNICTVALRGLFDSDRELESLLGISMENYRGCDKYDSYAMQRFQWIMLQVINPYNKICYKFDEFEGAGIEQMNYPWLGVGDCEDTAQAVNQFIRGIQLADQESGGTAGGDICLAFIMKFLRFFTPCMCVISTSGPEYTKSDMAQDINSGKKTGLHMLCCLVPVHLLLKTAQPRSAKHRFVSRLIPVETTGFNYNSYVTPNMLLSRIEETSPAKTKILEAARRYNVIVNATMANKYAADETVNFAIMINDQNDKRYRQWGSGESGNSFVNPHYFYGKLITMCHSLKGSEYLPKFLDFYYANKGIGQPGVNFKDAVLTLDGSEQTTSPPFVLQSPVDGLDASVLGQIDAICQEYANNVQPVPIEIYQEPTVVNVDASNLQTETSRLYHDFGSSDVKISDCVESMVVRSISFYINKTTEKDSLGIMKQFESFLESKSGSFGFDVKMSDIEFVSILNGAIEFYALHVYYY